MPKPGKKVTYHLKKNLWEFWQYTFSPTVILAEKKIKWYNEEKLQHISAKLKEMGLRFYWNEAKEYGQNYQRHNASVEIYMKFPPDVSFSDKVEKMEQIIAEIGCL